jgi:hypothetical protein
MASKMVLVKLAKMISCPHASVSQVPLVTHPLAVKKTMAHQTIGIWL